MSAYKVSWDQWYRCGYAGDDTDYEPMSRTFQHLCDANQFIDDLVAGKFRGVFDRTVHRNEVQLFEL